MTPLTVLIASIAILTLDYIAERYFQRRYSVHPHEFLYRHLNPLLRNTLK